MADTYTQCYFQLVFAAFLHINITELYHILKTGFIAYGAQKTGS